MSLLSISTAMRGMKIRCIIITTGNPAPRELTNMPSGIPWAYWLAEMPPKKSVDPARIGPKKSNAQYPIIIHMSLFHLSDVISVFKEKPLYLSHNNGRIV